jgi:hypothetical protein
LETATLAYSINTFLLSDNGYCPERAWAKDLTFGQRNAISSIQITSCDLKYFLQDAVLPLTADNFPNLKRIWITEAAVIHFMVWEAPLLNGGPQNARFFGPTMEECIQTSVEFFNSNLLPKLNKLHGDSVQVVLIKARKADAIESEG